MKVKMGFLTETPFIIGIVVTICAVALSISMLKPNKTQLTGIKDWTTRDSWVGEVIVVPVESWYQNDSKYGNDFFYDFCFYAKINGVEKKYCAKGVVRPDDVHKIKKGISVAVKYSKDTPPKMAVLNVSV